MSDYNPADYQDPNIEANDDGDELPELSDYGRRFVEKLPEEDRPKAEQWVREWDGGYKKQVSRYEEQLGQYRQLGNIEDVQAGTRLYQLLVTDPQRVLHYLTEDPNGPKLTPRQAAAQMQKIEDNGAPAAKVDPNAERLEKLERALLAMAQRDEQRTAETQAQRDQQAFVDALDEARTRLKIDFDNRYVAYLLSTRQAQTIDEAVRIAGPAVRTQTQPRRAAPNLLGASSAAPSGAKKPNFAEASPNEIKDYIVHSLTAGND